MTPEIRRATLAQRVDLPAAIGTLSLRPVTVALEPAEIGSGLRVQRTDTGQQWPISLAHLLPATNCTAIGDRDGSVAFLEHLLAALWAGGISDVLITTDGPEIPLYDGSAMFLWQAVQQGGRTQSAETLAPLRLTEVVDWVEGDQALRGEPLAEAFRFSYELVHPHPLIGTQTAVFAAGEDFGTQLAPARTFATAEQLRATRGQEPNAAVEALCLVVYDDHLSERPVLPQAFARHKLVDLLGDLYLCGRPVLGAVSACRTGHQENHEFLKLLLAAETG